MLPVAPLASVQLLPVHLCMLGKSSSPAALSGASPFSRIYSYCAELTWWDMPIALEITILGSRTHTPRFYQPDRKHFDGFCGLGRFLSQATHWAPKQLGKTRERGRAAAA